MLILLAECKLHKERQGLFGFNHNLFADVAHILSEYIIFWRTKTATSVLSSKWKTRLLSYAVGYLGCLFCFPLIRPLHQQEGKSCRLVQMRTCQAKMGKGVFLRALPSSRTEKWEDWERKALETKTFKKVFFFIHHFYYSAHATWHIQR